MTGTDVRPPTDSERPESARAGATPDDSTSHDSTSGGATPASETTAELGRASIDVEAGTVTRSVVIRADRSAVWSALTTPDLISLWFGDSADFAELAVGARGTLGWADHGDIPMEIVRVDEQEVFAFRWGDPGEESTDQNSTVATFTLETVPGGTRLSVVETGFELLHDDEARRRSSMESNRDGWNEELDDLVAYLELQDSQ